jgi:hypothetical protein
LVQPARSPGALHPVVPSQNFRAHAAGRAPRNLEVTPRSAHHHGAIGQRRRYASRSASLPSRAPARAQARQALRRAVTLEIDEVRAPGRSCTGSLEKISKT